MLRYLTKTGLFLCFIVVGIIFFLVFFKISKAQESHSVWDCGNNYVSAVYDGDTITVKKPDRTLKIRFFGIDCPEKKQNYGLQAQQFVSRKILNKNVCLIVVDKDKYGRSVSWVADEKSGEILNNSLLKYGLAWHYTNYTYGEVAIEFNRLEKEAKEQKIGLWSQSSPINPSDYRKKSKESN